MLTAQSPGKYVCDLPAPASGGPSRAGLQDPESSAGTRSVAESFFVKAVTEHRGRLFANMVTGH